MHIYVVHMSTDEPTSFIFTTEISLRKRVPLHTFCIIQSVLIGKCQIELI